MKKQLSLAAFSLFAVAGLLTALVILYLYLHHVLPEDGFFWQSNAGILAEVAAWSLAGGLVHAFIFFCEGLAGREDFQHATIWFCALQVLLAPVLALLLFYTLYYLKDDQTMDKSFLFLSFMSGLLSGQLFVVLKEWFAQPADRLMTPPASLQWAAEEIKPKELIQPEQEEAPYGMEVLPTLTVVPVLDDAGLFFDEKREVLKAGFESTSVTLQSETKGEIVNANKTGIHSALVFVFDEVPKGHYTLRALQCLRLPDKSVLYLFGEQEVEVDEEDLQITLSLRKVQD